MRARAEAPAIRPRLTDEKAIAAAIGSLEPLAAGPRELWRLAVGAFAIDLDTLAALLPVDEPEPTWLRRRPRAA
jgi:hypothetical protein